MLAQKNAQKQHLINCLPADKKGILCKKQQKTVSLNLFYPLKNQDQQFVIP